MPIWVYFERDPELDNIWVAHLLDLDLVTQGESLREAIFMATDAAITTLAAALFDTNCRASLHRTAPQEDWERLWALFRQAPAQQIDSIVDREAEFTKMGTQLRISAEAVFERWSAGEDPRDADEPPDSDNRPVPFMPLGAVA
jgi:predicted RNase H-like HicB family nuclease